MNYSQQAIRDALAAEYVLGTLKGGARKRYQQLMMESQTIREATWMWEQHLNGLGEKLPPVEPDEAVWVRIQKQLGFVQSEPVELLISTHPWWKPAALFAMAAALVLAVLFGQIQQQSPIPEDAQHVAVFLNEEDQVLWLLDIQQHQLAVRATQDLPKKPVNDYQLWMVAKDGRPPISLGLLPQEGRLLLPKHPLFDKLDIAALAVSLEPLGGSPNGLPTEVLFTAPMVEV